MNSKNNKSRVYIVLLVDLICLVVAYYFAFMTRHSGFYSHNMKSEYINALIIIMLLYIVVSRSGMNAKRDIFKLGYIDEFLSVGKNQSLVMLIWFLFLFISKQSDNYSRFTFIIFFVISTLTIYVVRGYIKIIAFIVFRNSKTRRNCAVITVKSRADKIVNTILRENEWDINISGIVIVDADMTGKTVSGIEVWGNHETMFDTIMYHAVDEVFINIPYEYRIKLEEIILELEKMGILVHLNIDIYNMKVSNKRIDRFSSYNVVTFATTIYTFRSLVIKRILDILGSVIGILITMLFVILVAPAIKLESKGPVFFSQERVGKNGRIFKIYKFRSMYVDAEERKKELLEQNEMHGLMFKMKDDPRITKVGKFIRKTSIDEFPQFFNVLVGDMSLVGTRPPTIDEFRQYEAKHRRRLSIKPGLTGLWQASGRNSIDDFDEVVKYDLEYIDNWSVGLDIKLLLKTILVVFNGTGS